MMIERTLWLKTASNGREALITGIWRLIYVIDFFFTLFHHRSKLGQDTEIGWQVPFFKVPLCLASQAASSRTVGRYTDDLVSAARPPTLSDLKTTSIF